MLIRCPTCSSGHELAPDVLSQGRILRCAYCRDSWRHGAVPDRPSFGLAEAVRPAIVAEAHFFRSTAVPPPRPAPSPAHRGTPARTAPRGAASGLAAAVLVLATLGGGMAAVACKARLVAAFPPSQAVFAALGLPVNLAGLSLGEIRSTVVTGDGPATLTLEGHITNLRTDATPVPPLRIAVRDKNRRELYYWTAPAPKAQLAAGETVLFRSRLSAPPRDGQDLAVSFAESPAPATARRRVAEMMPGDR